MQLLWEHLATHAFIHKPIIKYGVDILQPQLKLPEKKIDYHINFLYASFAITTMNVAFSIPDLT